MELTKLEEEKAVLLEKIQNLGDMRTVLGHFPYSISFGNLCIVERYSVFWSDVNGKKFRSYGRKRHKQRLPEHFREYQRKG